MLELLRLRGGLLRRDAAGGLAAVGEAGRRPRAAGVWPRLALHRDGRRRPRARPHRRAPFPAGRSSRAAIASRIAVEVVRCGDDTATWSENVISATCGSPSEACRRTRSAAAARRASRVGFTSFAAIEPETSSTSTTVASCSLTLDRRLRPREPDEQQREPEQEQRASAGAGASSAGARRGSGAATAPPRRRRARRAGGRARRSAATASRDQRAGRASRIGDGEAHRPRLPLPQERGERAQPVALGRDRDVPDAGRREARDERARARPPPPRRSARAAVDRRCRRAAGVRSPGSTSRSSPTSASSCSRGSRTSTASTACRPASRSSGARQSSGPRKSETTTTSARWRRDAVGELERVAQRAGAGRRRARAAAAACRAARGGPAAAARRSARAERDRAEPVAAARRRVADRDRDAFRDVGLPAVGRAERHRRRRVEHEPRHEHALGELDAHVRLAGARRHVPLDPPHVVARLVRAHLPELAADARRTRSGSRRRAGRRPGARRVSSSARSDDGRQRARARLLRRPDRGERI